MSQVLRSFLWNVGILAWACWMAWGLQHRLSLGIVGNIPGTDWINWEKNENQLLAAEVLYPAQTYEAWQAIYPEKGSSIKEFDYQKVIDIELLKRLIQNTPIGSYRVYSVDAPGSPRELQTKLIQIHPKPLFEPISSELSWNVRGFLYLILFVGGAILIALQYPFVRYQPDTFGPLYVQSWVFTMLIGLHFLQLALCLTELPMRFPWIWPLFLVSQFVLIFILTTVWQRALQAKWQFFYDLIIWLFWGVFAVYFWKNNRFLAVEPLFVRAVVGFSAWKQLQFLDSLVKPKSSGLVWSGYLLAAFFVCILLISSFDFGGTTYSWIEQSHPLTFAFLLAGGVGRVIRFGNIRRVLIQSGGLLLAFVLILLIWVGIHKSLTKINLSGYYGVPEIVILMLLLVVIERILRRTKKIWLNFLEKIQLSDSKQWLQFLSDIPKTPNTETLIRNVSFGLQHFLEAKEAQIALKTEPSPDLEAVFLDIQHWNDDSHWSAIPALSAHELPETVVSYFQKKDYVLVLPILFSSGVEGFLALGSKRIGEYTVADLTRLRQAVRAMQLSLEILRLLEKEKILTEKNLEASLTALRAKINPHFLFNTLNSISELIHAAPNQAEEAVQKLAFIFRYTLKYSDENFVTLASELSLVRNYLEIEKLRFGDRLLFNIELPPDAENCLIPSIMIQTLVENCIKHGTSKLVKQGEVTLRFWVKNKLLMGEVTDNGPGIDTDRIRKGNGLDNVLTRLETLYPGKNVIQFKNTNPGTTVLLSIPQ